MNDDVLHQICQRVLSCHSLVLSSSLQQALDQELAEHRISQKLRTYGLFLLRCLEHHPHLAAYFLKELKAPNIGTVCAEATLWTLDAYSSQAAIGPPPQPLLSLLDIYPEGLPSLIRVLCKHGQMEWAFRCLEHPASVMWNNQQQFAHEDIVSQISTWGLAPADVFLLLSHPCVFEKMHPRHLSRVVFHLLCHEDVGLDQEETKAWIDRLLVKFKIMHWMKSYELLLFTELLSSTRPVILDCAAHFFSHPLWSEEQRQSMVCCWVESHANEYTNPSLNASVCAAITSEMIERKVLDHLQKGNWSQCDVWLSRLHADEQMSVLALWLKKHVEQSSILPTLVDKMHLGTQLLSSGNFSKDNNDDASSGRRKM